MAKELQSSCYIVISFLVREMGIDIVEAISLMAELEKKWLGSIGIKWRFNTQRTWRSAMKRITANQYQTSERYYKLPKLLFESERYKNMKLEVKVVYSVLKDRLELSLSKGWIDEDGAIYLIYSNSNLMALLGCSKSKLLSM